MSSGRMEGTGCVTWWGFGPARDLLQTGVLRPHGELNVLLVGSGDPRHILKTIAGLEDTDSLHVWVVENSMDVVARQLLLLYVALSAPENMGMQEKTEVFLEMFGNSEIRSQTDDKLKHIAAWLFLSVTDTMDMDTDTGTHAHPCLDTSLLKFKERDVLAQIFKQWQHPPAPMVSMSMAWDARVRQHLGARYDARKGCYDWDLTMKLHDRGCGVIHKHEYGRWRESGVAFELREGLYCAANQSLLSMRVFSQKGNKVGVRGYWGDIVSSPYLSFGVETDNKELLKMQNNTYVKTAQDISTHNLQMLFNSLCSRGGHTNVSELNKDSDTDTAETQPETSLQQSDMEQKSAEPDIKTHKEQKETKQQTELMDLNRVRISFLSVDSLPKLCMKSKYCHLFNAFYCSASMVHHVDSSLTQTAAHEAILIIELAKYLLDLSKEQQAAFATKVGEIAKEAGFLPTRTQDDDAYAMFTLQGDQ